MATLTYTDQARYVYILLFYAAKWLKNIEITANRIRYNQKYWP